MFLDHTQLDARARTHARTHTHTKSVGLLWRSDHLVAKPLPKCKDCSVKSWAYYCTSNWTVYSTHANFLTNNIRLVLKKTNSEPISLRSWRSGSFLKKRGAQTFHLLISINKDLGATSKFQAPEAWHEASSIPKTHKYYAPPQIILFPICAPPPPPRLKHSVT
jgi:hypothetical protein